MTNPDEAALSGEDPRNAVRSSEPPPPEDASDDDGLPEWEPLTPELVEEEALRGDFMLRWAAVLLAVLLGTTVLDQTPILVHVKTGQWLASHGILPPADDFLSATAAGHEWVNLSWLWDLVVAGCEKVAGFAGLSLLTAVISFFTFRLVVTTNVPEVPTWWGSVCAVIAIVACFPTLTATPQIITLLGVAWTMSLLYQWQREPSRTLWPLVGLFVVWANLDPRAWIGGAILVLFSLGTWCDLVRLKDDPVGPNHARQLSIVAVCAILAMAVHPFLWETWIAPIRMYGIEYPVLRAYTSSDVPFAYERYSTVQLQFWKHFDQFSGASLLLMATAAVTLLLNRKRLRLSTGLVLLGANTMAVAGGREMAVASIINAMASTINAQQWYQATFRQTYSIEPGELIFSRVGRALTVFAAFGLGIATVSGHFMGADGRRVGMGLSSDLSRQIESYQSVLADAFDQRAFNFRLEQGDLLVWLGFQPFIDSRVTMYGMTRSLVGLHLRVRTALRESSNARTAENNTLQWSTVFDEYEINQALPRLSGLAPDYMTYFSLLRSRDWQLTEQGAATAVFYRTDSGNAALDAYLDQYNTRDYIATFLRTDAEPAKDGELASRGLWPRPPTFYDTYVYLPETTIPNDLSLAAHYNFLREFTLERRDVDEAVALAYATIRSARQGLREHPNQVIGYRILAMAYEFLAAVETRFQQQQRQNHPLTSRFHQIVSTYHQVLDCKPDEVEAKYRLFELFDQHGRFDLALKYLQLVKDEFGSTSVLQITHPNQFEQEQANDARLQELRGEVERVQAQVKEALEAGRDRLTVAQLAYAAGCPLLALEVLEGDLTVAAANPVARLLMAIVLLEVGRTAEARDQLETLRGTPVADQSAEWPVMTAIADLAADELEAARETLSDSHDDLQNTVMSALINAIPLRFTGPIPVADGQLDWAQGDVVAPILYAQNVSLLNSVVQPRLDQVDVLNALIALEMGDITGATQEFQQIKERNPTTTARPIIDHYLMLLTGAAPSAPPTLTIPTVPDFASLQDPTPAEEATSDSAESSGEAIETEAAEAKPPTED